MSRWATSLAFDGEENPGEEMEYRAPFLYNGNGKPDERGRGGLLFVGETLDADDLVPFLNLTVATDSCEMFTVGPGVDVTLDESHARELHRYLGEWLGRLR